MNVRLAKPFGVRVGELVDRLEALSYRHGRPQFAISYCIVPAKEALIDCAGELHSRGARKLAYLKEMIGASLTA